MPRIATDQRVAIGASRGRFASTLSVLVRRGGSHLQAPFVVAPRAAYKDKGVFAPADASERRLYLDLSAAAHKPSQFCTPMRWRPATRVTAIWLS